MTSCNFVKLGKNLEVLSQVSDVAQLATEYSCQELALTSSVRGKIWNGYLGVGRRIGLIQECSVTVQDTIKSIRTEFQKALNCISFIDSQYRQKLLCGESTHELTYKIVRIASCLPFFFSLTSQSTLSERLKPFKQFDLYAKDQEKLLHRLSLDHALCTAQLRIGRPYPFKIFEKIIKRELLDREDENILNEWIAKVQRSSSYITVGLLHAALRGCVETIIKDVSPDSEEFLDKLSSLEWRIFSGKDSLLQEDDPEHIRWVHSLTQFDSDVHKITVGKRVFISDDFTIFEPKKDQDRMIICGKNSAHVGMWRSVCTHFAWSVQPVSCLFQDPEGRFCIIEKVDYSLHDVNWTSCEHDRALLDELAKLLEFWATHSRVPKKISCKDLFIKMRDDKLLLKVISPISFTDSCEPDYNRLEAIAWHFAKGNFEVHAYLMKKSRLIQHPVALAYSEIALKALSEQSRSSIEAELTLYDITDPDVLRHAVKYVADLKNAQGELFERLRNQLKKGRAEDPLFKAIAQALVNMHKESGFFSVGHPELSERLNALENSLLVTHKAMFK